MRTIARNHKNKIAAVRAATVKVTYYDQRAGAMHPSTVDAALGEHQQYDFARLVDNGNGTYNVNVHSNLWYVLYTQGAIDRLAAEQAERDATRAARPAVATPTREQRNAATIARTTSIHDLGKPATPAVTVTRTRLAVNTQVKEACAALGIQADYFVSAKASGYTVPGHGDFTLGQLADLVLVGGFDAAFGANETRPVEVNPFAVPAEPTAADIVAACEVIRSATRPVLRTVPVASVTPCSTFTQPDQARGLCLNCGNDTATHTRYAERVAAEPVVRVDYVNVGGYGGTMIIDRGVDRVAEAFESARRIRESGGTATVVGHTEPAPHDAPESSVGDTAPADLDLIAETAEALSAPARFTAPVTPVRPVPVVIDERAARIAQRRALTLACVDASALVGMFLGGPDDSRPADYHQGTVISVDPDNAGSAWVLATLDTGHVVRVPKSLVPGVNAG